MKRKPISGLARGVSGRWTAKGTISLQVRDPHDLDPETLKPRRVNPRAILPDEPAAYETLADARAASYRLADAVQEKRERGVTVRMFWEQWTDVDHWAWRIGSSGRERTEQTMLSYRQRTANFVRVFGDRPMQSITFADVNAYMASGKHKSEISACRAMFTDATRPEAGPIRSDNPWDEIARTHGRAERRKRREVWVDAPEPWEIQRVLAHAHEHMPYSIYAWLFTATETGMRCGELDAMKVEHLDLSQMRYRIEEQFNHKLGRFTAPKYNSHRTIDLSPELEGVLRRCIFNAAEIGSPFLFPSERGTLGHWNRDAREWYWTGKGERKGKQLRSLLKGGQTLYESTRHYFTTQAVLDGAPIHFLAPHLGHSDKGETLMAYYARLNDEHRHEAMQSFFANRNRTVDLRSRRNA